MYNAGGTRVRRRVKVLDSLLKEHGFVALSSINLPEILKKPQYPLDTLSTPPNRL